MSAFVNVYAIHVSTTGCEQVWSSSLSSLMLERQNRRLSKLTFFLNSVNFSENIPDRCYYLFSRRIHGKWYRTSLSENVKWSEWLFCRPNVEIWLLELSECFHTDHGRDIRHCAAIKHSRPHFTGKRLVLHMQASIHGRCPYRYRHSRERLCDCALHFGTLWTYSEIYYELLFAILTVIVTLLVSLFEIVSTSQHNLWTKWSRWRTNHIDNIDQHSCQTTVQFCEHFQSFYNGLGIHRIWHEHLGCIKNSDHKRLCVRPLVTGTCWLLLFNGKWARISFHQAALLLGGLPRMSLILCDYDHCMLRRFVRISPYCVFCIIYLAAPMDY